MKRCLRLAAAVFLCLASAFASASEEEDAPKPARLRAPVLPPTDEAAAQVALPSLNVIRVRFRGNRKVEDDAVRSHLRLKPGMALSKEVLQDDVRAIWRLGYFEDIQVETAEGEGGLVVTFVLKEKPAIRKIYVSGHDEVGLTKINEVLDLKKEQVLDLAKLKRNVEKIRELYLQRGFYMAEVEYELRRDSPGEVDVYFRVHENSKVEIRRVNFTGNHAVPDAELHSVIMTQPGDLFSALTSSGTYREDVFQRDILIIQSHYFDRGYINVKVGDPRMELSPDRRSMYLTLAIEEGQQYRLGSLDVKGELIESRETYLARLQAKPGEIFNRTRVAQDVQNIADMYKDKGYAYVNTTPETRVDDKRRTVDLTFDIQKGPLVTFERINIRGNSKTRDKVIRREMRIYEGEQYSQSGLDLSKRRVNALGFFDKVEVTTKRGSSDDTMEVNVEVGERQTGAFQIGAGFSSVEQFIFQAQISQNNLLGRGQSATLQAQVSGLRQLYLLQFEDPYFLDTNWTFGFNLFNQQRYYLGFTRKSTGGSLTWGYMLRDNLRLYLTYTLQDVGVSTSGRSNLFTGAYRSALPTGSLANLLHSGILSSWRVSVAYDSRDDRMFPHRGWYNTASAEFAERIFLSQSQFTRYEGALRYYYPLWGPFTLRLKAEAGIINSRDPQGVPIFERYFVGGIYDVRGFALYSLGPKIRVPGAQDLDSPLKTFSVGGNLRVLGKAEIEVPIFEKMGIRGVVFTDVGNAYNLEAQYCRNKPAWAHVSVDPCVKLFPLTSLRTSWGFGFRWFSPIGPLRFEWGLPYQTLPGEDRIVFEFTIGNEL
ncbi:MAG: outer membrane protein assembly factor BamA [Deltaproteobacteria bacterium]|nr:outer membrane protein assembly factor BamA [Deltaproteobacteria bacterium]